LNERPNPLAFSGAIELPKGVLSEYQCSFITNQDPKQTTRVKNFILKKKKLCMVAVIFQKN